MPVIAPQMMLPELSVVRALVDPQVKIVAKRSPPPVTERPPAMVDVAVVEVIPSVPSANPPANVDVAVVEVACKYGAAIWVA